MNPVVFFFIIIAVIWILSGIASVMTKAKEAERRRLFRMQMDQARTVIPVSPIPTQPIARPKKTVFTSQPMVFSAPGMAPAAPPPPPVRVKKKAKRAVPPAVPAVQVALAAKTVISPQIAQRPLTKTVAVNATTLSRWLTPQTLRQQFMLTEILNPPMSLREDRF